MDTTTTTHPASVRRVRLVDNADLDQLVALASGTEGHMTTMPRDPAHMAERITTALQSVDAERHVDGREVYFFVLDEAHNEAVEIAGTSAIYAAVGLDRPFYNYKITRLTKYSPEIDRRFDYTILQPSNDYTGTTEVGTLYLPPERRGGGRGRLLSFARFLYLAVHRERFGDVVIAEMRGWIDDDGRSPFWEAVGNKFFDLDLGDADRMSSREFRFMQDLLPGTPIHVDLLPDEAQAVIAKPHRGSEPAAAMLAKIGMRDHGYIDIFDAGPCLDAFIDDIDVVRRAIKRTVHITDRPATGNAGIASNTSVAGFVMIEAAITREAVQPLSPSQAAALDVAEGDTIVTYIFEAPHD